MEVNLLEYRFQNKLYHLEISNCTFQNEMLKHEHTNNLINCLYVFSILVTVVRLKEHVFKIPSFVIKIIHNLTALLLAPLIILILLTLYIYRKCVELILERRENYCGLVSGPDAYWALQNDTSKPIICILMTIEVSEDYDARELLVKAVKERLLRFGPKKLTCSAKWSKYGYCYWLENILDLDQQIRRHNLSSLETALSNLANEGLPSDTLWEILVAEKPVYKNCYYVVFRIHHSIGDGFSLMKHFLQILVDKSKPDELKNIETNRSFVEQGSSIFNKFAALFYTPIVISKQIFSKPDFNAFHNRNLLGEKFIFWKVYKVKKVKEIKDSIGCSFTSLLLFSIAKGLQHNLSTKEVTLVIPAKIAKDNLATDGFTLALLKLPLKGRPQQIFALINEATQTLKRIPDYLVNYWLMNVGFSVLPLGLMGNTLKSEHATFIFSNLPGPCQASVFGNTVQDIKFWLPHRDKTGVGISVLSYGDNLNIGISADKACIPNSYQVEALLDRIVANLDELALQHNLM